MAQCNGQPHSADLVIVVAIAPSPGTVNSGPPIPEAVVSKSKLRVTQADFNRQCRELDSPSPVAPDGLKATIPPCPRTVGHHSGECFREG